VPGGLFLVVYFVQESNSGNIKIGYTGGDVKSRIDSLKTGNSNNLELVCAVDGGRELECALHILFKKDNIRGEWFKATDELIEVINEYKKRFAYSSIETSRANMPLTDKIIKNLKPHQEQFLRFFGNGGK